MRLVTLILATSLLLFGAGMALGQNYTVTLDGNQEVPPSGSSGTGSGTLTLDAGKMLSFNITFSGLSGTESAAHIHGPATVVQNAGVQFPLPLGDPKVGSVGPLSLAQEADLNAGLYYVNIHTDVAPGGEIRGQILVQAVDAQAATWGKLKLLFEN